MIHLLDVNMLLALAWPSHVHHAAAHDWFAANHEAGWATCPITQLGYLRLSMQPAVVKCPMHLGDVMSSLTRITSHPAHRFWTLETGLEEIRPEIRDRIGGHNQLTDALLLDLAIRNQGRLATLDRRVSWLLPQGSPLHDALAIVPV